MSTPSIDLQSPDWLAALFDETQASRDSAAVCARLPPPGPTGEIGVPAPLDLEPSASLLVGRSLRVHRLDFGERPADEAFVETARGHVELALDLAALGPPPHAPPRHRAAATAFLAAALGESSLALDLGAALEGAVPARLLRRAHRAAGRALLSRYHPPGDPVGGLALYPGALAVLRRHLARVAMGLHRHRALHTDALERHRAFAERELVFLAEALSASALAARAATEEQRALRLRQVSRLGLRRPAWREARAAVLHPRPPDQLADAAPERVRPFLLEQLQLALLLAPTLEPEATRWVEAFAAASGLPPEAIAAARVEAAARHADHHAWFEAIGSSLPPAEWASLADAWEGASDQLVERVTAAVNQNLGAIVTELRETGELGQLLAKATAGHRLTADEKRKVREQLVDLAKAVPALAIFAAPGGLLLLPLLAKLLPFNMLPSAWDKAGGKNGPKKAEGGK
ncbi:MAG TPA: LETM1 domain-containing protein [Anaeromyxobacteraceae bacterium]|nr:LETM1 domain-containing protein [Anaeromyxobacteraceae bacterium]